MAQVQVRGRGIQERWLHCRPAQYHPACLSQRRRCKLTLFTDTLQGLILTCLPHCILAFVTAACLTQVGGRVGQALLIHVTLFHVSTLHLQQSKSVEHTFAGHNQVPCLYGVSVAPGGSTGSGAAPVSARSGLSVISGAAWFTYVLHYT